MRLAFVTGCLEPGRDGVGDYARVVAQACAAHGHEVRLAAVADDFAPREGAERAGPVAEFRQSRVGWRADGGVVARRWLDDFAPDWTCLQFVPYSFGTRGLFGAAIPALARVLGAAPRRQIYFHEIWVGTHRGASWGRRWLGAWQRRALVRLLKRVQPERLHTNTLYHADALATLGRTAERLALCGNVPGVAAAAPARIEGVPEDALVAGMFGTLHASWEGDAFLEAWAALGAELRRPVALVAAGGLGAAGAERFAGLAERWRGRVVCRATGRLAEEPLAGVIARFDLGVTAVPWNIAGKSSAAAALRERGLRVVVTSSGGEARFPRRGRDDAPDEGFVPFFRSGRLPSGVLQRTAPGPDAAAVAERWLEALAGEDNDAR